MKYVTCEMPKVALAALILGVFSMNPMANAEPTFSGPHSRNAPASPAPIPALPDDVKPADANFQEVHTVGLSMAQLNAVGITPRIEGNRLMFSGSAPEACVRSFSGAKVEIINGKNTLQIDMTACNSSIPNPKGKIGSLAFLTPITLQGDGKLYIRSFASGDLSDPTDEALLGRDGKQLDFTSQETIDASGIAKKVKADGETAAAEAKRKKKEIIDQVNILCKAGDFKGVGEQLDFAQKEGFLTDTTKILEILANTQQNALSAAITKGKDAGEVKDAYDNFLLAAQDAGWDTEVVSTAYVDRRVAIISGDTEAEDAKPTKIGSDIRELVSNLKEADLFDKTSKAKVAFLYSGLATKLKDAEDFDGAEKYFNESLAYTDAAGKVSVEADMAKMFAAAADACLDANKLSPGKCDALAKKAKKHMDGAIAAQGKRKGDGSLEDLQAMKVEKIQMFGMDTAVMNISGYGVYNPNAPGSYDQKKAALYRQGLQEKQQQQMMQQQMQRQGMQMSGSGSSGGFFH